MRAQRTESCGRCTWTCGAVGIAILHAANAEDAPAKPDEAIRFASQWGGLGAARGRFDLPIDIVIAPSDATYITERYNDRAQKIDAEGKSIAQFPALPNPGGLALDKSGSLYVSRFAPSGLAFNSRGDMCVQDSYNHHIQRFLVSAAEPVTP